MELRYYKMPEGSPILALLGQKWIQNYGNDVDYLHFHNYLEIGFCYEGQGTERALKFISLPMRSAGIRSDRCFAKLCKRAVDRHL